MEQTIYITQNNELINLLFGNLGETQKKIESQYHIKFEIDPDGIKIIGKDSNIFLVKDLISHLNTLTTNNKLMTEHDIDYAIMIHKKQNQQSIETLSNTVITVTHKGKPIKPKTMGQKKYIDQISKNDIVFGIDPAGTGKTYLAMAMAIKAFKNDEVDRIILTRPAVEAGESLGFLPGDLQEKIDPYLRPIYDALFDVLGYETYTKYQERGLIEVAPLAYMRGRTLENAYVILDEAQNTTSQQMKMFLTRIGYGSKAIITGDITQVDLPKGKKSGLVMAEEILQNIEGISFMKFNKIDIVRHPLVQKIISAYEKKESEDGHRI